MEAIGSAVLTHPSATTLRLNGTIADINASLAGLTFTGTPGSTSGSVQVITTDLDARTPDPTVTVDFTILNAPALDLPRQPSVVAGHHGVADRHHRGRRRSWASITVTLTPASGALAAQAAAGATVSTASDGTLTITGDRGERQRRPWPGLTFTAGRTATTASHRAARQRRRQQDRRRRGDAVDHRFRHRGTGAAGDGDRARRRHGGAPARHLPE